MADLTPINPEWMSRDEVMQECNLTEGGLRYWVKRLADAGKVIRKGRAGRMSYFMREDIENILKPEVKSTKKRFRGKRNGEE